MAEEFTSRYHRVAENPIGNGPLSSLSMLWKTTNNKKISSQYERPPFPIMIEKPTVGDTLGNLQFSDYSMGLIVYLTGMSVGYYAGVGLPNLRMRLLAHTTISHAGLVASLFLMYTCSYKRLTGYWDNGLRWKNPDNRYRKFDSTSVYEANTMAKRLRVNTESR